MQGASENKVSCFLSEITWHLPHWLKPCQFFFLSLLLSFICDYCINFPKLEWNKERCLCDQISCSFLITYLNVARGGKGAGFAFGKWAQAHKLLFYSFFIWSCIRRVIYLQMNYFNNRFWVAQNIDYLDPISAAVKVRAWVWLLVAGQDDTVQGGG